MASTVQLMIAILASDPIICCVIKLVKFVHLCYSQLLPVVVPCEFPITSHNRIDDSVFRSLIIL
jgi:hypothetical protein